MIMKKPVLLASLGLMALGLAATPAAARDNSWYIGLRGGVSFKENRRFFNNNPALTNFNTTEKLGWAAAARLGYDFGMLRTEIDFGYHQNNLRSVQLLSTSPSGEAGTFNSPEGRMRNATIMANALVDVINTDPFTVSVGAGAGVIRADAHNMRINQSAALLLNDSDYAFAWNALARASMALGPNVELAVDYRYLRPNRAFFQNDGGPVVSTRTPSHMVLAGLNFNFGGSDMTTTQPAPPMAPEPAPAPMAAPEPAPAPAPAPEPVAAPPAPAGPVMVFFDFDRDEVTAEGRQIITQAADPQRQGTTTITLGGFADRAGSPEYNKALGQRRARAVQRELAAQGVDASRVTVQSFGEDRPLVDTADGVREPQNRRVEITVAPR